MKKRFDDDDKDNADRFCGANVERKWIREGLLTRNDQRKESKRKEEIEVHGLNKRRDWKC